MYKRQQDYLRTGSEEAKKAVISAGDALLARVNGEAGYIRAWDEWGNSKFGQENRYRMIADTMCNIPLLFVCTELTGDRTYYDAAVQHARLTPVSYTHLDVYKRQVLGYAFEKMKLHRVELTVLDYNLRGIRCYEKCGFRREGVLRESAFIEGEYHSDIMMSILESEYRSMRIGR